MNLIDQVFGISPQVLSVRSRRSEMIAANLANADTPGYKARDVDFAAALSGFAGEGVMLSRSDAGHLGGDAARQAERYRVPSQPSLDGNTVETQVEHAEFMENAIRYQASLNFLDGRIKSTLLALRGE